MAAQVKEALDRVVELADEFAAQFVDALPHAASEDELRQALSGTLLTFLAESILMTAHE